MQQTHVAEILKRRRKVATSLRELSERHGRTPEKNHVEPWADPRNDWYWERVADDLIELIDRGKLT